MHEFGTQKNAATLHEKTPRIGRLEVVVILGMMLFAGGVSF